MTTRVVHRPARVVRAVDAGGPRKVEAPPALPDGNVGGSAVQAMLPAAGVLSSLTMMLVFRGSVMIVVGAVLLVVTVVGVLGMLMSQRGQAARTRRQQRERYREYLEELREELVAAERAATVRDALLHPPPSALYDVVRDPARRWERRRGDADFLRIRIGVGTLPVAPLQIEDRGGSLTPVDPFMLAEARAVVHRFATAPGLPLLAPLDSAGNVSVVGARADVLAAVRALLVQAAALHAPDDLGVAVAHPPAAEADWRWAKWLPHTLDGGFRDGPVAMRRMAASPDALFELLRPALRQRAEFAAEMVRSTPGARASTAMPRLIVVHDTYGRVAQEPPRVDQTLTAAQLGTTVLHLVADRLQEPSEVAVRITVAPGGEVTVEDVRTAHRQTGRLDDVPPSVAEGVARSLAPLRLSRDSIEDVTGTRQVDFAELLGIADPAGASVADLWADHGERGLLRVPIGLDERGEAVLLDLKEPAQLGMGPHGLCVGATGSGKSELLRSLVLALVTTHPPERLSMVLVDYKGGATFAPFEGLPHVAGVITNLADDVGLVDRVHTSLAGEVQRRQQVLKDAGNVANIADYTAVRAGRPGLPPLPHLLVIIDEFGELLTARPDFIELFLSIGRIGRSIGVHLLLSSQRIEGGKLRGLETYLSYRLGLRTFSEAESRTVLETPDAYHLPPLPGYGYLKVDTTVYRRFKAAYVSGPYVDPTDAGDTDPEAAPRALPYPGYNTIGSTEEGVEPAPMPVRGAADTLLDVLGRRLAAAAEPVQPIWLPPLPRRISLDRVAGKPTVSDRGLRLPDHARRLSVPMGLLDDPARQWQGPWALDLTVAGGHVAVIGGPHSGRSTLLRTLVTSLSLTHTPREVAVYAVDLTGGLLNPLAALPHVGGVATRTDPERVRRTVEEVRAMLDHRERVFRDRGIDGLERLRAMHAAGELPELPAADVVLVIDGWAQLVADFDELEPLVTALLQRGGGFGIHVVAAMLRWYDVRIALQSTFGTQVELRLGDPTDSAIDRRLAETIRPDQPGRALLAGRLFAQVALPRIDGLADDAGLGAAIGDVGRAARAAWHADTAPPVRVLPSRITVDELPPVAELPHAVPVGVDETPAQTVRVDLFAHDGNLLVLGDAKTGKTNLLRLVARILVDRYTDDELVFAVVDPRRGLREVVPDDYVGGYASNGALAARLAAAVAQQMADRETAAATGDAPGDQPRVVLLVDDYDVIATPGQNPLAPLVPYLPAGPDLGLHVVLARPVTGSSRGLFEPFLQTLRDSGTTGLVMAGDRGEGQLFPGVYARPLPPGRGLWVRRGEPVRLIQTALAAKEDGS